MNGLKFDTPRGFVVFMVLAIFGNFKSNLGKQIGDVVQLFCLRIVTLEFWSNVNS